MTKVSIASAVLVLWLAPLLWATTGQEPHPPTNLEIPFLERDPLGARWTAMGGAGLAATDDGSSISMNPAGLAKIRRIELLGTIEKLSSDVDATWFGTKTSRSLTSTALREMTLSFPFPTYRGSLVVAGSLFRRNMLDAYTVRAGTNSVDRLTYRDSEERDGVLTGWAGALAVQVSPQAYLGFEAHFFSGSYGETYKWNHWGACDDILYDSNSDLGGYGGTIGVQFDALPQLGIGAVLKSPQRITLKGDLERPEWDPAASDCVQHMYSVDDVATLPYSMGLGFAYSPASLLLTFDLMYTDWREMKYPGPIRDLDTLVTKDYTGDYIYQPTTDVRAGIEYSLKALPLRFRAGYARVPLELNWFDVTKDRTSLSFGAGAVVQSALSFDLTWQRTSFERKSTADQYSEKRTDNRVLLTLAYRF